MSVELTLLSGVAYRGQDIPGPRLRGLLALLARDLRPGCSTARLVEELWPDERPENPTKAVQILVSRVRGQLGPDVIARTATGYRLTLAEDQVDSSAVLLSAAASVRHSRAGDHAAALAHAEAGLGLWAGPPADTGAEDDPVSALRAERASTYRSLVRSRALALSGLGRHAEAVEALTELARERPRDEEVMLELLRCEAATTGPSAALTRYEAYRRSLRDDLGTDPGPALQAVYRQLLRGEAPAVRHGVPHDPNPLLGRDGDIAAVAELIRASRVTSIVGPGGLGKTRLAYAVSRQAEQRFVQLVALASVRSDDDVVTAVASAVGVGDSARASASHLAPLPDALTGIVNALGSGPALLVLDNCEHVIRGAAELVRALVSTTRELRILTTSRAPLNLSSESVYLLPELSLSTSVELFEQRARAARSSVDLPRDVVEDVCRHLDGLPLAVELAAARVRAMSVAEVARRLDDRFTLLRGGPRDAPERHHTLQAVVDWSWNLLDPAGQAAMRALSVFPGGFTAGAAQHLVAGDVLSILEHLVDQSLLKVVDTAAGTRFQMLETVRELSAARREEVGETDRVVDGFLAWARDFGLAHHDELLTAVSFSVVLRIRAEQDNLVQALRYGLARDDAATVVATSAVLNTLWSIDRNYARMVTLIDETAWILSHFRPEPAFVEVTRTAATLSTANSFMLHGFRAVRALAVLRRLPPAPPDTPIRATAIILDAAREIAADRAVLHAFCDSEEPLVAAVASAAASYVLGNETDPDTALKYAQRMLDAIESAPKRQHSPWLRILARSLNVELYMQVEQGDEAWHHAMAALRLLEEYGPWMDVAQARGAMAMVSLLRGEPDEAERWSEMASQDGSEDIFGLHAYALGVRAEIRLLRGDAEAGLRLWRRAVDQWTQPPGTLFRTEQTGRTPWELEIRAVAVAAHAYHGQADLVAELVEDIANDLSAILGNPIANPPTYVAELPLCGALLLALSIVDINAGRTASGVRMVALAERLHYLRAFQPTMSSARARKAAEQADRSAYAQAVASYADLGRDDLRAAALSVLSAR